MTTPALGAIGCTPTYGSGFDKFFGSAIRYVTATKDEYGKWKNAVVNHSVIYVGQVDGYDKPQLMQATPSQGFSYADWDTYGDDMVWINNPYQLSRNGTFKSMELDSATRQRIVHKAQALKGRKYGFLDILAIATAQRRVRQWGTNTVDLYIDNPPWWVKRLGNVHRLICSQAVDYAYHLAGIELFADHRLFGLVSPADLLELKGLL